MIWLIYAIAIAGFVELAKRLPLWRSLLQLSGTAGRAAHVVRSRRISDHWKERVLLVYARHLFIYSLASFFFLAVALAPVFVLAGLAHFLGYDAIAGWSSVPGLVGGTLFAVIYLKLRQRLG